MKFDVLLDKAKIKHDMYIESESFRADHYVMYVELYDMLLEFKKQKALSIITESLRKEIDETFFIRNIHTRELYDRQFLYFRIRALYLLNFKKNSRV